MKKLIVRSLGAGTALVLALAANQAGAQSYVDGINMQLPNNVANVDNSQQTTATYNASYFNTALYGNTLEDVIITLTGQAGFNSLILYNNNLSSGSFNALSPNVTAGVNGNTLPYLTSMTINTEGPTANGPFIVPANGLYSPAYGQGGWSSTPSSFTSTITLSSAPALAAYEYAGAATFPVQFAYQLGPENGFSLLYQNGASGSSTEGGVGSTFHIEYEYSAVPEASTIGLIAGLGCLVALVRRARD